MNRNEKKKPENTFVMFLYACGVFRVHQEFELFEQILKNVLLLNKILVDSYFDDTVQARVTDKKCFSLALLSLLFPLHFFLLYSSLL